ncbi:MAG: sigma-54 dependent transcriptional regulator [Gammaproteobacteria bacterium]|nr:sigma-54 dependent transcriptional regulator [Gammaproteobacteria bacterium]
MSNPAVLIVEDDADLRNALCLSLESGRYPVLSAGDGNEALDILDAEEVGLVVSDVQMAPMNGRELLGRIREQHPSLPAVLMTAYGTIEHAVDAMRCGATDYLVKPFEADDFLAVVERHLRDDAQSDGLIAADPKSQDLVRIAAKVAASNATVTLSGESGTGKEVFARYIHQNSPRRDAPFVAINCAAIPENMLEAMLFGHEKGAFTGASAAHAGKFEQANGGTLLLDEVSEMELGLQAKILRAIQEREVERIGGRNTIELDVRVLATTNRDLQRFVADGRFREDLYYRLNVFPLHIPALRERPGDIVPLARLAVSRNAAEDKSLPELSASAEAALLSHAWPGNVRELENTIARSLILHTGNVIDAADLVFEVNETERNSPDECGMALQDDLQKSEFKLIVNALRGCDGIRSATADKLGISPRTLRYKIAKFRDAGLTLPSDVASNTH